jgi:hypothetical protein
MSETSQKMVQEFRDASEFLLREEDDMKRSKQDQKRSPVTRKQNMN